MQNPHIKVCGEWAAVGDVNGSTIYMFGVQGMVGSVDTSLSISQIEVAKQGIVAAVLEDTTANYINLYNTDGSKIYTVKTTLAGDGYPLDISISEDATKLIASYLYVSGESIKTNVVFYNFSEVGQNETERVVGGFNHYDSTIVGDVEFLNSTTAVAVGEDVLSIYHIKEYPSLTKEIRIDSEIERVFFGNGYIGIVLKNSDSGDIYKLVVYDTSAKEVCETTFNTQYDTIQFDGKSVLMSNASTCSVMNLKGKINNLQIVTSDKQEVRDQMRKEFSSLISKSHEELMRVKDNDTRASFYIVQNGDLINEMIMLADTDSDYVVIRITGKFTLEDIQEVAKSFEKKE